MRTVEKPWGSEIIWAETAKYAAKFLLLNPRARLSLQVHERKHETLYALEGDPTIIRNGVAMALDEPVRVWPGATHRIENWSHEPAVIVEVSTPELDDVVRLEDDYGRAGRREALAEKLAANLNDKNSRYFG